jgi:hypothetical protein
MAWGMSPLREVEVIELRSFDKRLEFPKIEM